MQTYCEDGAHELFWFNFGNFFVMLQILEVKTLIDKWHLTT